MDFAKISKAMAGGFASGIAAVGGTLGVHVTLPPGTPDTSALSLVLTFIGGFLVGFVGVYVAPANAPAVKAPPGG